MDLPPNIISHQERVFLFNRQKPGRGIKRPERLSPLDHVFSAGTGSSGRIYFVVCFLCLSRGCHTLLTNSSYTVTCTLVGFRLALWWIQVTSHTWISSLCYSRAWWSMSVTSQHCKPWVGKSHKGGKSDCHPQPEVQWVCTGSSSSQCTAEAALTHYCSCFWQSQYLQSPLG